MPNKNKEKKVKSKMKWIGKNLIKKKKRKP
jgi:hypothetical protein